MMHLSRYPLLFLLLLLPVACSKSDDKDLHRIDLCVAVQENGSYGFLLDEGFTLIPDNGEQWETVSMGGRYQIHYNVSSRFMNDETRIYGNILDIYPIRIAHLLSQRGTTDLTADKAVRLERIWLGGDFLNLTVTGDLPALEDAIRFLTEEFIGNTLQIRLVVQETCSSEDVQSTFSCPLSEIPKDPSPDILVVEVLETDDGNDIRRKYTFPLNRR